MRINLAKVLPGIGWLLAIAFVLFLQSRPVADTSGYQPPPAFPDGGSGTTEADAYLDEVAAELARPGLYVDPDVIELDADEVRELDAAAADQAGPVRIAVLPAERLMRDDRDGPPSRYGLAHDAQEMVAQLYDRVGSDGTYAILVDAGSESEGRSFTAAQYAEEGPTYDVEGAVEAAVDCCAPEYAGILGTFIDEAGDEEVSGLAWLIRIGGGVFAIVAGWFGWRWWKRRRTEKEDDRQVTEVLRAPLQEEVIELSTTVSALPPATPDTVVANETVKVLDLVESARQRLDTMETDEDAEAVATRLADARYSLTVIDALRAGRPRPQRFHPRARRRARRGGLHPLCCRPGRGPPTGGPDHPQGRARLLLLGPRAAQPALPQRLLAGPAAPRAAGGGQPQTPRPGPRTHAGPGLHVRVGAEQGRQRRRVGRRLEGRREPGALVRRRPQQPVLVPLRREPRVLSASPDVHPVVGHCET
jgi:hypothetical protein